MSSGDVDPPTPGGELKGAGALDLYAAKIGDNVYALTRQLTLLRRALASREELMCELTGREHAPS